MCLHKMEQRATGLGVGQLFDGAVLSEFCVMQKQEQEVPKACLLEKVHSEVKDVVEEEVLYRDVLVGATQATRQLFDACKELGEKFRRSTTYKILTRTTQPSHAISMLFVSFILLVLWPNLVGQPPIASAGAAGAEAVLDRSACPVSPTRSHVLVSLAYFGSFAMHFGAQMWMTFVSGLALYFNLPRHIFGRIQEILFPKYFSMGTGLSVVTLLTFIKLQQTAHPELLSASFRSWDPLIVLQLVSLALCAALELIVWLYLAPPMLRLMHQKYHYEASETVGQEVGHFSGTENAKLKRINHYQTVHKRFRQIHMVTAMANMVSLLCTFVHLHYMASRVQLL